MEKQRLPARRVSFQWQRSFADRAESGAHPCGGALWGSHHARCGDGSEGGEEKKRHVRGSNDAENETRWGMGCSKRYGLSGRWRGCLPPRNPALPGKRPRLLASLREQNRALRSGLREISRILPTDRLCAPLRAPSSAAVARRRFERWASAAEPVGRCSAATAAPRNRRRGRAARLHAGAGCWRDNW